MRQVVRIANTSLREAALKRHDETIFLRVGNLVVYEIPHAARDARHSERTIWQAFTTETRNPKNSNVSVTPW